MKVEEILNESFKLTDKNKNIKKAIDIIDNIQSIIFGADDSYWIYAMLTDVIKLLEEEI